MAKTVGQSRFEVAMLAKLWKTAWRGRWAAAASLRRAHTASDDELRAARTWLAQLTADTIPRSICAVSFSRSSGPGGQNVNKYDSRQQLADMDSHRDANQHGAESTRKRRLKCR